ncbi:MAG: glycosyltransferase [Prolixibacteraceae bacterium]|nr:glycosyltransferase [Prolixibacteraceae bacterium]MBN2773201.1 glycosyltransferase [Prolixibacteraceae bacterium]
MKIVKIINSLEQGGAEKLVVELLNELSVNHEVFLITFKDDSEVKNTFLLPELSSRVTYINLKLKRGLKLKDVIKLYKTLKQIKPDIVHCHLYVFFHTAFYAFFNRKTKYFHTIHNDAEADCSVKYLKIPRRLLYKWNIFHPVTISDQSRESYNKFYKLDNSTLIYNGRKTPEKSNNYIHVQNEIESLKEVSNNRVFVHVTRYDEKQKNHTMLIDVFNRLINEGKQIALLIIGVGFDSEKAIELKKKAKKGIYFLGSKNNVADYFCATDAFCLSSRHEGMPITLFEALACGCVPVCTPVGGIKDIITDGENGYLSSGTDEESYYQAVKKYLDNSDAINKEKLINYFENNFTIEKCASEHEQLYYKAISSR